VLRRWVRLGVAAGLLGAAVTVAVFVVAPRGGHAATCTDSWLAGNGDWMTPANWSNNAVPNSGDVVCISNNGTFTVTLSSNTSVQVGSLTVGGGTGAQTLVIGSGMTFEGSIVIAATGILSLGDAGNADTRLTCAGTCTDSISNAGMLQTVKGGGGTRNIEDDISNGAGGTIDYGATESTAGGGFCGNVTRGITNQGTVTVDLGAHFTFACGSFVNQGGTVAVAGGFAVGGGGGSTFVQRGGTVSGQGVVLSNGSVLDDDTTAAAGIFAFMGGSNPSTGNPNRLTGHGSSPGVAPNQTVTVLSGASIQVDNVSNAGTIIEGSAGAGDSLLECYGGCLSTLTNTTGTLQTINGGGGARNIGGVDMVNQAGGTLDFAGNTVQGGGLCGDPGRGITNSGTVTVDNGGHLTFQCGIFSNQGGSVANAGGFAVGGGGGSTFGQRGGSVSGQAVVLSNGSTLDDDTTAAAGNFAFMGGSNPSNGNPNRLLGTGPSPGVALNQTITVSSGASASFSNLTNAGSILLGDSNGGDSTIDCYGGCISTLTNTTGTFKTVAGGGGARGVGGVDIVNLAGGTLDYGGYTVQGGGFCGNPGRGITNNGTAIFEETGYLTVTCGGFVQGSGGTFETTIDANTSAFGQLANGDISIDGKLQVTTIGLPAANSTWPIISSGTFAGKFATWDLRSVNYWRHYLANGLTLVANGTCNTFTGEVDDQFGTNNNWSFGLVPDQTEDACITATTTTVPPTATDSYTVLDSGNPTVRTLTLGGPSGTQTLTIPSSSTFNIESDSAIGPRGVLVIGSGAPGASALGCQGIPCTPNHPVLSNSGTIDTVLGDGSVRHVQQVLIANMAGGTFDVVGNTSLTGGCQPGGGLFNTSGLSNDGTVSVEASGVLQALCGLWNNGTVANHGTVQMGGDVFEQRGTESGNPVIFTGGSSLDPVTIAGPGSFLFRESGGIHSTGGTAAGIAAGDTVTIASTNTIVTVFPPITNAGTIIFGDNSGNGDSTICCEYFTGPTDITNIGLIKTVPGGGGIHHFQQNITNAAGGTIDIAADTRQDPNCGPNSVNAIRMVNNGTFTIETGGHYTVGSCPAGSQYQDTFAQSVDGTLQTTINVNTMAVGQLSGGVLSLNGVLRVSTIGSPALGSQWSIITGANLTGAFAVHDFGGIHYAWHYTGTGLTLMLMGLNPCAQVGNGWGCNPVHSPPPPSPGAFRIRP
jgi:fibronectin-binding autotransporter adhesin